MSFKTKRPRYLNLNRPGTQGTKRPVLVPPAAPQNTSAEQKPMVCSSCNLSARFEQLMAHNTTGVVPEVLYRKVTPVMKCAGCGQVYRWVGESEPGARDGGWVKYALLDDLEALRQ